VLASLIGDDPSCDKKNLQKKPENSKKLLGIIEFP